MTTYVVIGPDGRFLDHCYRFVTEYPDARKFPHARAARQAARCATVADCLVVADYGLDTQRTVAQPQGESLRSKAASPSATHEGWSNYETWAVQLWIDNTEWTYEQRREMARETLRAADFAAAADGFGERIKNWVEDNRPRFDETSSTAVGLWTDLLNAAVSEVDWDEIARAWLDEAETEVEAAEREGR